MRNTYAIAWQAKASGKYGVGSKRFEKAEAERLAGELNHEYPEIYHEVVNASRDNELTPEFLSNLWKRKPQPETIQEVSFSMV